MVQPRREQHFLIVSFLLQGHVNPTLRLAKRLATITGAAVTFSTAISSHRRMFPSLSTPDQEFEDGILSYIPYSDGYDDDCYNAFHNRSELERYYAQSKLVGSKTLSDLVNSLAARHRPVSCIIYSFAIPWVMDVARDHGIPSVLYWLQPATAFAIYHHYFHGFGSLIAAHVHDPSFELNLPGVLPLKIQDLPSLLTITDPDNANLLILAEVKALFDTFDREDSRSEGTKPKVLLNTFDALETEALAAIDSLDLIAIGPMVPCQKSTEEEKSSSKDRTTSCGGDLFPPDKGYMEWLDSKPEKSVVYISFGSLSVFTKRQQEEILDGLKESGRPYLWVVRKDNRVEGVELDDGENGMVVEWCNQVQVLSHRSVGCFVTHCGWNSITESLVRGVPMVAVPRWMDQGTNTWLMEEWGTGVRAVISEEGVLEGRELRRCLDVVIGEGELRGAEIRKKAEVWGDKAREAIDEGG